jgi:hypothetical protein
MIMHGLVIWLTLFDSSIDVRSLRPGKANGDWPAFKRFAASWSRRAG